MKKSKVIGGSVCGALFALTLAITIIRPSLGKPVSEHPFTLDPTDSCDWEGSGLFDQASERVVVPIHLRCLQGTVKWLYPNAALQVTLRHGTASNVDFRGCIRIATNATSRVRIFIEGVYQSLHKIYSNDDGQHPDSTRCFVSHEGQVSLNLEADQFEPLIAREVFQFSYHLEPVTSKAALIDDEECRPCTDQEMHTFFCKSDFIVRGTISALQNNEALERTELTIRATKVYKTLHPIVSLSASSPSAKSSGSKEHQSIVLHRPLRCNSKAGMGSEFLFMGSWVLGNPVVKCAPKVSYWKHVKSRALASASNQCQLS